MTNNFKYRTNITTNVYENSFCFRTSNLNINLFDLLNIITSAYKVYHQLIKNRSFEFIELITPFFGKNISYGILNTKDYM